ncbi:MbcA/ParS/Xre antitoxin family protein [Haloferula sp. A504]|uniref:MbcA/ParS/Xre antitoxin family protein n=1 Tax=Haloferula sp. A504 TaxID=3373601 RepID=UPI0031C204C2|nr:MbcA/ParS/Xre antitoxin family protein [Verrucomicrobiaceae bacterium E54]
MSTMSIKRRATDKELRVESGPALMKWRQAQGIPRPLFAKMADFSERKLATYEKALTIPQPVRRPIKETVRLIQALRELADDDATLRDWLERPNPAFGKRPPLKLITDGESDVIWQMVHQIRQGAFS